MFTITWIKPHAAGIGTITTPNIRTALEVWHVMQRCGRKARVWTRGGLVK